MKEILYTKSKAVAALNSVEGFSPMDLARKLVKEGQEDQLYLDVKYRKLWFRLVHPAGKVISYIRSFTESMALVEARVYLDKCDPEDSYIANSFSQKFRTDDPVFGDKFLEMAETAAIGRALSDAGFGLQFADVTEPDDPGQVDAGIPVPGDSMHADNAMGNTSGSMAQKPVPGMPGAPQQMPAQNFAQAGPVPSMQPQGSMMAQFYQQAQAGGSIIGQNRMGQNSGGNQFTSMGGQSPAGGQNPYQAAQGGQIPMGSPMALDENMPVEELLQRMSYEQAVQVVIPGKGKFGGKTMGQVALETPQNLEWFANSYSGTNHMVPAAARILLAKALPMAG